MAERHQTGVGGLPFSLPLPSSPSPQSTSPTTSPSLASTPPPSTQSAESIPSITPQPPVPHLGPGGLPLPAALLSPSAGPGSAPRVRGWGEKLMYETGSSYALGFVGGGLAGVAQGMGRRVGGGGMNAKLRLNAVLNAAGKGSSTYANSFAVFALMYSISRSSIRWTHRWYNGQRKAAAGQPVAYTEADDKYEAAGVAVAAALTGATRMPASRAMACGGVLGLMMLGGLKARRTYVDEKGIKLPHI